MQTEEEGPSEKVCLLSQPSQPATRINLETGVPYLKVRLGHEADGPRAMGILHLMLGLQKLDKSKRIQESRDSVTPAADEIRADVWMSVQQGNWRVLPWGLIPVSWQGPREETSGGGLQRAAFLAAVGLPSWLLGFGIRNVRQAWRKAD